MIYAISKAELRHLVDGKITIDELTIPENRIVALVDGRYVRDVLEMKLADYNMELTYDIFKECLRRIIEDELATSIIECFEVEIEYIIKMFLAERRKLYGKVE